MLRRKPRRPYRLVSVGVPGSVLYVSTGLRDGGPSRPRTRAHTGAGMPRPNRAETLRRRAYALLAGGCRRLDHTASGGGAMKWTEKQDNILRSASFKGAAFAADEIARRCGVRHSVRAVEMRASRISTAR